MNTTNNQLSRSELWLSRWDDTAKKENPFATMGRSSDTISEYFAYITDLLNGLDGIDKNTVLLDAAGGCGYLSLYFSTLAKEVHLFDYSEEAIAKAKVSCKMFPNIFPYTDNLLTLENTKSNQIKYKKILVGGVLQYFDSYEEIEKILQNLFDITEDQGRVFISQTTDLSLRDKHVASYQHLEWPEEQKSAAIQEELTNRFWIDFEQLKSIALKVGFKTCIKTKNNPNLFQSTHMFDFYLVK
ncbi:class I SAM-dependent methyltransferase [Paraglaciecola sp.]|nr:class I SAM-dependent methyltransferase [Paraglaciecola sp.]